MKKESENKSKITIRTRIIELSVCVLFYMFFCVAYGVYIGADSKGYMEMIAAREPVYPLLLALFRKIFGKDDYLFPVIVFQNLLQAASVFFCVDYLRTRFRLPELISVMMYAVNFGVAFLCQFASERGAIYSSNIMTEGITVSLWLVFMTLVLKGIVDDDNRSIFLALIIETILVDTRKQMAVGYIVIFLAVLICRAGRDKKGKYFARLALVTAGIILSLVTAVCGTRLYNLILRGEFVQNVRDMNLVLTTSLYVADKEDDRLIEDADARELFQRTYVLLEETESNYSFAKGGLAGLESHYEEHYDVITIEITKNLFEDFAREKGAADELGAAIEADRLSGVIVKSLLKDNIATYAKVYLSSVINGLVNTVAHRNRILDICAYIAYGAYIVLLVICRFKTGKRDVADVSLTVLGALLVNVGVTAALIFCQSRYMIYNMALFYMAGILMVYEIFLHHETAQTAALSGSESVRE
ncbi:MAG: glycosyltransferase family 39 protein [Lachnospiraceae bacterium]|nr:glycosyltransferase family 39 protein [Lachnospiraceae bacterium]